MSRQFPVMRGIAILFVLINHSITMSLWMADRFHLKPPSQALNVLLTILREWGVYAVPIFLFLSGAFFAYANQNRPMRGSIKIVVSNVLSVLWPYLVWSLVFYVVIDLLLGQLSSPLQDIKNLIVGYPYNFIPLLLFFFVLAPLISVATRRYPLISIAVILIVQLLEALIIDPTTFGFRLNLPHWMNYLAMPVIRSEFAVWGIFFPLGMIYIQHLRWITSHLKKPALYIALLSAAFYVLDVLHVMNVIQFFLAVILCPIFGLMLTPVISRNAIPFYPMIEWIGRRSYGLYLTNLTILTLVLFALRQVAPWLIGLYLVIIPILFLLVTFISLGFMALFERRPQRVVYPYLFG